MEGNKNVSENKKKTFISGKTGFILAAAGTLAFLAALYGLFKTYTDLTIVNVFNKSRIMLNTCNLNSETNIGCIAYIDNLRRKKDFNYSEPLKPLGGMSVKEFQKKYLIALTDPESGRIIKKFGFEFIPSEKSVIIKGVPYKSENKKFFVAKVEKNIGNDRASLLYIAQKGKRGGFQLDYFYSPKYWGVKEEYGIDDKNVKPFFYKGFQFIGTCTDFNKALDGDVKCKESGKLLRLVPKNKKKGE